MRICGTEYIIIHIPMIYYIIGIINRNSIADGRRRPADGRQTAGVGRQTAGVGRQTAGVGQQAGGQGFYYMRWAAPPYIKNFPVGKS